MLTDEKSRGVKKVEDKLREKRKSFGYGFVKGKSLGEDCCR